MNLAKLKTNILTRLSNSKRFQQNQTAPKKNASELQRRFKAALTFLKKTSAIKNGKSFHLNELPWYLLIGPTDAGKTSLLANADVPFILQKRLPGKFTIETSQHCDWWVTQHACIIDVPGKYFSTEAIGYFSLAWPLLLRLIKKYRGKKGISGILITLPLSSIMSFGNKKTSARLLADLFVCLRSLATYFPQPLSCQLLITQCDLLPGFVEFFAESSKEEAAQLWGVSLSDEKPNKAHDELTTEDLLIDRFNALIKKLNQQLLNRLHQERHALTRAHIKDFPLQLEYLKDALNDFIKHFSIENTNLSLQGVYLTSAQQPKKEIETNQTTHEPIKTSQHAIQIFNPLSFASRGYFIKQLIAQGIFNTTLPSTFTTQGRTWKSTALYTFIGAIILAIGFALTPDFKQSVQKTNALQHRLADYQNTMQHVHNADDRLANTLQLLIALQPPPPSHLFKFDLLNRVLTFYSHQSQEKTIAMYQQTMQGIFMPEIKNYLGAYLKDPVNRNIDDLYAALTAYLMMGNVTTFQAPFVLRTLQQILPHDTMKTNLTLFNEALTTAWRPLPLDTTLIEQTRHYLISMPLLPLSYAIFKSMHQNDSENNLNFGVQEKNDPILITPLSKQIPAIFTAKLFTSIDKHDIPLAAQEAIVGNTILGDSARSDKSIETVNALAEQLRVAYINHYVEAWENFLNQIHLFSPTDLEQINQMISDLTSIHSPLLQFLKILHDNTYFEPIISYSPKLQSLGLMIDKTNASRPLLHQILLGLQSLQQYIQPVLTENNEKKIAFDLVTVRMQNHNRSPDAITQLRLIAAATPEPIKTWLEKIADDTWHFLTQDASSYLDISWKNPINATIYQTTSENNNALSFSMPSTLNEGNNLSSLTINPT